MVRKSWKCRWGLRSPTKASEQKWFERKEEHFELPGKPALIEVEPIKFSSSSKRKVNDRILTGIINRRRRRRQLFYNTVEIVSVFVSVCMFIHYVPGTYVHEAVHYIIGMNEPNVEAMEVHVFDRYTSIIHPGLVMYKLRVPSYGTIIPISINEDIAYIVSLSFLCICMWFFVTRYVRWRGKAFIYNHGNTIERGSIYN